MAFDVTFNNMSVTSISWRSVLLLENTGENHRDRVVSSNPARSWQGLLDTTLCDKVCQ
jgi:hypothetical protein